MISVCSMARQAASSAAATTKSVRVRPWISAARFRRDSTSFGKRASKRAVVSAFIAFNIRHLAVRGNSRIFPTAYNVCVLNIPIGTKGEFKLLVTPELCIDFLGIDGARVFGTPWMIWYMELTARDSVKALLGDGVDTVGTHVDVHHLAATPLGMEVTF